MGPMSPEGSLFSKREPFKTQRPPLTMLKLRPTSVKTLPAMLQSATLPRAETLPARRPRYDCASACADQVIRRAATPQPKERKVF